MNVIHIKMRFQFLLNRQFQMSDLVGFSRSILVVKKMDFPCRDFMRVLLQTWHLIIHFNPCFVVAQSSVHLGCRLAQSWPCRELLDCTHTCSTGHIYPQAEARVILCIFEENIVVQITDYNFFFFCISLMYLLTFGTKSSSPLLNP